MDKWNQHTSLQLPWARGIITIPYYQCMIFYCWDKTILGIVLSLQWDLLYSNIGKKKKKFVLNQGLDLDYASVIFLTTRHVCICRALLVIYAKQLLWYTYNIFFNLKLHNEKKCRDIQKACVNQFPGFDLFCNQMGRQDEDNNKSPPQRIADNLVCLIGSWN